MRHSHSNNTTGHLWVEAGDLKEGVVADVAPILRIDRTYSFAVRDDLVESLAVGQRVCIPLGRSGRLVHGFVVGLDRKPWDSTLREVHSLVDTASFLTPELVELGRQISRHYCCPLGITLKAMTPDAVRRGRGMARVRFARPIDVELRTDDPPRQITTKRKAVLDALSAYVDPVRVEELVERSGSSAAVVRAMARAGLLEIIVKEEPVTDCTDETTNDPVEPTFRMNKDQESALRSIEQAIEGKRFGVTLLFGVSGAGKTEVYIRAIRRVIESGRQAIFLVPEIVLTTQLAERLSSRFARVAIQHSGLTESQRATMWRSIAAGEKQVIIGTRSAVFAPCPNLGLIVVDEEQESSYKNLQAPRFHVRDAAIMRAKLSGIPVVLGSATPALETWHRSGHRDDYARVCMPNRVNELPMPRIHIVDMRDEIVERKQAVVLSRLMERLLDQTLERGEQAMILMNRRGYANRVFCPACKASLTCPNCNVGLVVHATAGLTICHYCRSRIATPTTCPNVTCGEQLIQVGAGTQRIEQTLGEQYPDARIVRVDSDTMRHRSQYEKVVADFESRKIDILVGTQMIAKGLDFPFVSFVGMIQADVGGFAADFRAHERLFQLVTQVAGRAGRADAPGQVVVQTTEPALPALRFALQHDYPAFAEAELAVRRSALFPPFGRLARIVILHAREESARREAEGLIQRIVNLRIAAKQAEFEILGPNPCLLARIRKRYRYDLVIRTATGVTMGRLLDRLRADRVLRVKSGELTIDVDPVSMV